LLNVKINRERFSIQFMDEEVYVVVDFGRKELVSPLIRVQ